MGDKIAQPKGFGALKFDGECIERFLEEVVAGSGLLRPLAVVRRRPSGHGRVDVGLAVELRRL